MDEKRADARRKKLGVGSYRAARVGDKVVVFATGETPLTNYKVWLHPTSEAGEAPVHELWWLPSVGPQSLVSTPFSVHASARLPAGVDEVQIRDAEGLHTLRVDPVGDLAVAKTEALVYLHYANQFDLELEGTSLSFTRAEVAGDPLLSFGERYFYGDEVCLEATSLGELVSVTLEDRGEGERHLLSILLPPTRVSGLEPVAIQAVVLETITHSGAPSEYRRSLTVEGRATYIAS